MKYKGLKSKTILITGASSGMGEATARELSAVYAKLILIARTESKLASLAKELSSRSAQVYYYPCDVSNIDEVKRQTEKIKQEVGIPDIIINWLLRFEKCH